MKKDILPLLCSFAFSLFFFAKQVPAQVCAGASSQIDLDANFVDSRVLVGGNLWWDLNVGRYIVPASGQTAALFAGSIWMGGLDSGGSLRLAGQTYGAQTGAWEYWAGPLQDDGTTDMQTCDNWDKFFEIFRSDIGEHQTDWANDHVVDGPIPASVRGWPANGNPHFSAVHGFDLPDNLGGLAPFFDRDEDGIYDPQQGDFPLVVGDESIWWVFNDEGGGAVHGESGGLPLGMEIQSNAFAFATGPGAVEFTTFYTFRTIYKGTEIIDDFYLSLFVDPDLGCWSDDYIGCIPDEELGFIYNADANDENCSGLIGYGSDVPVLGVKVIDAYVPGNQTPTGLSKFMFFNNTNAGSPPPTTDPVGAMEFYNYMQGLWKDGTSLTSGGNGYLGSEPADFAFSSNPSDPLGWSECSASIAPGDRRFLMSFGPYKLSPGDIGEFTFAVVWLPSQTHPCPDITALVDAANEVKVFYEEQVEAGLTAASELAGPGAVQFSPNPVSGDGTLKVAGAGLELRSLQLFAAGGTLVQEMPGLAGSEAQVRTGGLPGGMYFYRAVLSNGTVAAGKVMVE